SGAGRGAITADLVCDCRKRCRRDRSAFAARCASTDRPDRKGRPGRADVSTAWQGRAGRVKGTREIDVEAPSTIVYKTAFRQFVEIVRILPAQRCQVVPDT